MMIRLNIWMPLVFGLTAVWMSGLSQAAPQRGGGKVTPTLTVTVSPSTITEGKTATGTVSRVNASLTSAVLVTLTSSDKTEATVPASVTIPSDASSTTFTLTGVNDGTGDGAKTVTITAAATGFKSGSANVTAATAALPRVRYRIQFFEQLNPDSTNSMFLSGANNLGQAVGSEYFGPGTEDSRAIFYDPLDFSAVDLNTIVEGIPGGWRIHSARSINSSGQIAARMDDTITGDRQAVMIDMNGLRPQLHIIPDQLGLEGYTGGRSHALDINEVGDIVALFLRDNGTWGVYVYNFGFLVPSPYTLTPIDLGIDTTNGSHRINNPIGERGAQVVGNILKWNEQLGRDEWTPFRITLGSGNPEFFPPQFDPLTGNSTRFQAADINDAGFGGGGYIYYSKKIQGLSGKGFGWLKTGSPLETFTFAADRSPSRLNESSDFVTSAGELFHGVWGFLSPVDLLDPADPDFATWQGVVGFNLSGISDRDGVTNFPQLFGIAEFDDPSSIFRIKKGFVLTPIPVP